jgi:amidase
LANELIFSSATALAQAIRSKAVSVEAVVTAHLQHIDAVNPRLNAVVQRLPDAPTRARQADADLARGQWYGPLHGVPFTVKEVFDKAGVVSPLDIRLRQRQPPGADAVAVTRLRQAGAILIGKTNCPPNGSGSDTENAVTGRTLNPYNLDHTPGGSSGGEAALIAAGGSPLGLGSDGSGGLRIPAHYCGLATLKPTSGRILNTGVYNQPGGLTDPRTQIGPLARTVTDLALVLPLICGPDGIDAGVVPMPWLDPADVDLRSLRVGYFMEDPAYPVSHEVARTVGNAAQALARAGAEVQVAHPRDWIHDGREINYFVQDLAGTPGRTIVEVYALWDHYRTRLLQFMADYDALLCPVDHHAAPLFRERDTARFDYSIPFSLAGYPCAVVRAGTMPDGRPIGVQIVAPPWREDVALALAASLEREFGGWQRPAL